ncbi:NAD(P)/FAD-dependent oxidoreductase [Paenibacillus chungangensis]|uniref:NAD(P)/FAD-dependent oxidoreductase n=1 Tax=Paenibacillus chungangensis TaxID=696535 RepID=A0ABW3HTY5_9BACL
MKELHTGRLYWPTTLPQVPDYPSLTSSAKGKAVIIGGGMSGMICGFVLSSAGVDTIVVERGEIAGGSTSANTGLLQFCNDVMLSELIGQIGKADAELFYKRCENAIGQLTAAADSLPVDVGFRKRSSLYFASSEQDLPKLKREYEALAACGFRVEYWEPEDIAARFPFRKPGAIVTHGDAEVNPYQFVHTLAASAVRHGLRIYEGTDIVRHDTSPDGSHRLHSSEGHLIEAEHVVYAVGYEPEELRGRLNKAALNRSYAIVTNVQLETDLAAWHGKYMLWETARPYLYLRTTLDNRIVAGGLDEEEERPTHNRHTQLNRSHKLLKQLQALFPALKLEAEYEWNATFGESRDNLPFIGEDPAWPNVYYSLGYGGNGTVYSMVAAHLLLGLIQGSSTGDDRQLLNILSLKRTTLANS